MPEDETKTKQYLILGLIIVVLLIVVVLERGKINSLINSGPVKYYSHQKVDESKMPLGFPEGFPKEDNVQIIDNSQNIKDVNLAPAGSNSGIREFYSKQTVDENISIYKQYFEKNGWQAQVTTDNFGTTNIVATKGNNSAQVQILKTALGTLVQASFFTK